MGLKDGLIPRQQQNETVHSADNQSQKNYQIIMDETYNYLVASRCFTYKHAPYIGDTLQGFAMQKTSFPVVSVIVDDASPDGEPDILRQWAKENLAMDEEGFAYRRDMEYGELIFGRHKNNSNAHFAILLLAENLFQKGKHGLKWHYSAPWIAHAKYFAMCEGDDYWTDPEKLQKQVDFMEQHPDCGLCFTDFRYRHDTNPELSGAAFGELKEFRPTTFREHLVNAGYIGPMTWLYRQDIYREGIANQKPRADGSFAIALDFFALSKVCYLDDVTAVYRSHEGSASSQGNFKQRFKYIKGILDTQLEYAVKYDGDESLLATLKMQAYTLYMIDAIEAEDEEFINEALQFFRSAGMEMSFFVEKCRKYVDYRKKYVRTRSSKPYKVGKTLLKPLKTFKS